MTSALLVDVTRCCGCRACQAACKQWNDLPAESTRNAGSYENPRQLSAVTWARVDFHEIERGGELAWIFARRGCMHCLHPGCAAACPVGALVRHEEGPVVHDPVTCMGCRYCMLACPFGVPTFEWNEPSPFVRKCRFCWDRITQDLSPSCAKACPTGAMEFGDRATLVTEAHERIDGSPDRYVSRVFGEHEVGGTSVLYLSSVSFEEIGFPRLGTQPVDAYSGPAMEAILPAAAGLTCALAGLSWFVRRREKIVGKKTQGESDGENEGRES